MIKVGEKKEVNKKGNIVNFKYSDVPVDKDEWASVEDGLPLPFDLVHMKIGDKIVNGWWTGQDWYSVRMKKDSKVERWKRSNLI